MSLPGQEKDLAATPARQRRPLRRRPLFWLLLLAALLAAWFAWRGGYLRGLPWLPQPATTAGSADDLSGARPGGAGGPGSAAGPAGASGAPGGAGGTVSGGPRRPGAGPGASGGPNRILPVTVAPATQADVPVVLNALGTVTSLRTVVVRPQVDGPLLRVLFREGQLVNAGELLAEIDPRPFQAQLAQAEGQLARDQALLENARLDLKRYETLVAQEAASEQQLDTQRALVRQYEGTVRVDQGQIDTVRLQLSYTRITAPFSGRLGLRQVDPGNIVRSSDANGLVTITQLRPIAVSFSLPEKDLAPVLRRYRANQAMTVQALDRDQRTELAAGRLTTLDNQIDITTGTLKMKAEFSNADGRLFPNQFVNVRLRVDTLQAATVVPSAAVQRGSPGTFVYVVGEDKRAVLRKVELGPVDGERTVIRSGVAPGERVVIDGVDNLRDGLQVDPISKVDAERAATQPGVSRRRQGAGLGPAGAAAAAAASGSGAARGQAGARDGASPGAPANGASASGASASGASASGASASGGAAADRPASGDRAPGTAAGAPATAR